MNVIVMCVTYFKLQQELILKLEQTNSSINFGLTISYLAK